MSAHPTRPFVPLLPALGLLLGAAGCQTPTTEDPARPTVGNAALLARVQPGDVCIAPVRDQTGEAGVPVEALRVGFAQALVERLYSPLDIEYTDGNWVESSFGGTPAPDALLVIAIGSWDTSHLYSDGSVTGHAEVVLFEGGSTTGTPLWGTNRTVTVHAGASPGEPPSPSDELMPRAARRFASEILSSLPQRDVLAAHE